MTEQESNENIGLLALVDDDELAPRLLAAWSAKKFQLADADDNMMVIAKLIRAESVEQAWDVFDRCQLAELLVDGGISDLARKWLQAGVARSMGIKPKKAKRAKKS